MKDIPNTEYITVNKDGIFVGGKTGALIVYGGIAVQCPSSITEIFNDIQETVNIDFKEVHIGAFDTPGKFAEYGKPSGKPGKYTWCRIKGKDSWVCFDDNYTPDSPAACMLAIYLGGDITADNAFKKFRSAVFNNRKIAQDIPTKKPVPQPEMNLKRRLQGTDLSKLAGKTVELSGYKITISKVSQRTK